MDSENQMYYNKAITVAQWAEWLLPTALFVCR